MGYNKTEGVASHKWLSPEQHCLDAAPSLIGGVK